jgi:hypothetical protein
MNWQTEVKIKKERKKERKKENVKTDVPYSMEGL